MNTAICWFRKDLRVHDNPTLVAAAEASNLVCVYCIHARHDADSIYGPAKLGPHRRAFLRESLADLRRQLRALGNDLIILEGAPGDVLPSLAADCRADVVHVAYEAGPEEQADVAAVRARLGHAALHTHESGGLYGQADLPFALVDMPVVFTRFRKAVEAGSTIDTPLAAPAELPPVTAGLVLDDAIPAETDWPATAAPFTGGETAGLARLDH